MYIISSASLWFNVANLIQVYFRCPVGNWWLYQTHCFIVTFIKYTGEISIGFLWVWMFMLQCLNNNLHWFTNWLFSVRLNEAWIRLTFDIVNENCFYIYTRAIYIYIYIMFTHTHYVIVYVSDIHCDTHTQREREVTSVSGSQVIERRRQHSTLKEKRPSEAMIISEESTSANSCRHQFYTAHCYKCN